MSLFQKLNIDSSATSLRALAELAFIEGDYHAALIHSEESLSINKRFGDNNGILHNLIGIARLLNKLNKTEVSVQLFSAVQSLIEQLGLQIHADQSMIADRSMIRKEQEQLRLTLGEASFNNLWDAGKQLSIDQAASLTLVELNKVKHKVQGLS